jgi:hypothetical protein
MHHPSDMLTNDDDDIAIMAYVRAGKIPKGLDILPPRPVMFPILRACWSGALGALCISGNKKGRVSPIAVGDKMLPMSFQASKVEVPHSAGHTMTGDTEFYIARHDGLHSTGGNQTRVGMPY